MAFSPMLLHAILLILCGLAVYSNTLHVPFQFDDPTNIADKPVVRNIGLLGTWDGVMQPRSLTYFTLAMNYRLQGTTVTGYHIVNILIHVTNALLLYGFVILIFRTPGLRQSPLKDHAGLIALFSALLFVSHPVQTQAVTYIVQRLASLAALFSLAAVSAYLKFRLAHEERRSGVARWGWYAASLVAVAAAMKSKETAFTLPFLIALCEFLFFTGDIRKRAALLLPFLITLLIIPVSMLGAGGSLGEMVGDVSRATRLETNLPRMHYLFTEFRVIATYVRLLFFPMNQNLDYDYPVFQSFFVPEVFISFLFLAALFGGALYLLYRDRNSPAVARLVAFGMLWFFITLSVESSVIPIADVIFEHRLYLPSIGFAIATTTALFQAAGMLLKRRPWAKTALLTALTLVVILFSGLAYARNTVWRSEESLWLDVIEKSPMKARGYNGLGLALLNKHAYDRAIEAFARAMELEPAYGTAFNNIGNALYFTGRYDQAIEAQTRAILLQPVNAVFLDNRGLSHAARGDDEHALEDYARAIALDPSYAKSYHNIGVLYHRRGLYQQAIEQYTKAIALDPATSAFHGNRGLAYAELGEYEKSIADFSKALLLDPLNIQAHSGRGEVYIREKRYDEAIADLTEALSAEPFNPPLLMLRGTAQEQAGRTIQALADFQLACDKGDRQGCSAVKRLK